MTGTTRDAAKLFFTLRACLWRKSFEDSSLAELRKFCEDMKIPVTGNKTWRKTYFAAMVFNGYVAEKYTGDFPVRVLASKKQGAVETQVIEAQERAPSPKLVVVASIEHKPEIEAKGKSAVVQKEVKVKQASVSETEPTSEMPVSPEAEPEKPSEKVVRAATAMDRPNLGHAALVEEITEQSDVETKLPETREEFEAASIEVLREVARRHGLKPRPKADLTHLWTWRTVLVMAGVYPGATTFLRPGHSNKRKPKVLVIPLEKPITKEEFDAANLELRRMTVLSYGITIPKAADERDPQIWINAAIHHGLIEGWGPNRVQVPPAPKKEHPYELQARTLTETEIRAWCSKAAVPNAPQPDIVPYN